MAAEVIEEPWQVQPAAAEDVPVVHETLAELNGTHATLRWAAGYPFSWDHPETIRSTRSVSFQTPNGGYSRSS